MACHSGTNDPEQQLMCKFCVLFNLSGSAFVESKKECFNSLCTYSEAHTTAVLILNVFQIAAFSDN